MNRLRVTINCGLIFLVLCTIGVESCAQEAEDGMLESAARKIMTEARYAGLTTIDSLGYPNTRTMDAISPTDEFVVWMATNPSSRKVRQVRDNASVALYYSESEKGNYVTLIGKATLVNDLQTKEKLWKDDWAEFYPTKKDIILIRVEPIRLEVVSYEHGIISESKDWKAPEINIQTN